MRNRQALSLYKNRKDAGEYLAEELHLVGHEPAAFEVVLGLPRGGVPVAYEVARAMGLPLDVWVVRKLGVPGHQELAMGAIASGGIVVWNDEVLTHVNCPWETVEEIKAREIEELHRREELFRDGMKSLVVSDRDVLLVDDGLATGATMKAAVLALKKAEASKVVVAVPVGAAEACEDILSVADEVICPMMPEPFHGVGAYYEDFTQTSDEKVRTLLISMIHMSSK